MEDGLTASLSVNACQYSIDGVSWNDLPADTETPVINTGDKISFKATGFTSNPEDMSTFTVNKKFNLKGNVMSMLFGDEGKNSYDLTGYDFAFFGLFNNCTTLQSVSKDFLPATTLTESCYESMFRGCTSLVSAPELPATTLTDRCYSYMFQNCKSLVSAPELPATTLADSCYDSMFYGTNVLPDCTNIDFSSSTVVQSGGLQGLFAGTKVTDSDLRSILPINPYNGKYWLPAMTLANNCYSNMFQGCTGLTTAPELPATTLAEGCYEMMFYGCTSLVTAPELPATTLVKDCYSNMFEGCTSLVTAPELPATTLANSCYDNMFEGCTSLNYIKALFTTTPGSNYTNSWVYKVASTGTFVKNAAATWNVTGSNGIPKGWTVETATV